MNCWNSCVTSAGEAMRPYSETVTSSSGKGANTALRAMPPATSVTLSSLRQCAPPAFSSQQWILRNIYTNIPSAR